jgi:LPXTG-motif cell wall-anchored protein
MQKGEFPEEKSEDGKFEEPFDEYGWKMENGQPVKITDDYLFTTKTPSEGQEVQDEQVSQQATSTTEGGTLLPTSTGNGGNASSGISPEWIIIGILGVALLGLGYVFLVKKRRKR